MSEAESSVPFPSGLLEWAGHRSGGVRRIFHEGSGRPGGIIDTPLLRRLREWAAAAVQEISQAPRIVLLVGGPGNGKTEAVEATIGALEASLRVDGQIQSELRPLFNPTDGRTVPRRAFIDLARLARRDVPFSLTLVQDASVADPDEGSKTAAAQLVEDLENSMSAGPGTVFLACVNRGVLDDALIFAIDRNKGATKSLLESIVQAVSTSASAPPCWPLHGHPEVAIWPMDVESLLVDTSRQSTVNSPGARILERATDASRWPALGTCSAGENCPYCRSRDVLSREPQRSSLLRILRWYELTTGKRLSFRDLFSLFSFLLAGAPSEAQVEGGLSPCDWAAKLIELDARGSGKPDSLRLAAPFTLNAAQYQHALFSSWRKVPRGVLRTSLRDLGLEGNDTLMGLSSFLSTKVDAGAPSTLRAQLAGLCEALDPALADPDADVEVSGRTSLKLREIDARFSRSVAEGYEFIRKYKCLSPLESSLLQRLSKADQELASSTVRRRKPTAAASLQMIVREFCCRVVRRSVGVRSGIVRDAPIVREFELVVGGDGVLLYSAAKQVEELLNAKERFVVSLNTTFGQPLPPESRRVILTTAKQRVRPAKPTEALRPSSDVRFLSIGSAGSAQSIPLTYDLFCSVTELRAGMAAASLPRTVTALLETARARLAGRIVRDEEQLDGSEIRIGTRPEVIVRELGRFIVRQRVEE